MKVLYIYIYFFTFYEVVQGTQFMLKLVELIRFGTLHSSHLFLKTVHFREH